MEKHSRESLYFYLLLLFFMLAIVMMSFAYDPKTRLMPLLIGIPTLCLIVFQIVVQFNPRLQGFFEIDLFHSSSLTKSKTQKPQERGSLLFHTALILLYFILIFLLGFALGTSLYLCIFFKTYAKQSWGKAVVSSAIAGGLLYLIFNVGLQFNLFEGLLFGGRP